MIKNYIAYSKGEIDVENPQEVEKLESNINKSIASFDVVRMSYLSEVSRLRNLYGPVLDAILSSIKSDKQKLETMTNSEVKLHE